MNRKMHIDYYEIKQFWKKQWLIDVILFVALCITIFLTYKTSADCKSIDYNSFLLNLSTEIIGVWLSVRIIDRLLKKRERLENARRHLIANLRHPYDYAYPFHPHYKRKDVDYLKNEMKWFEKRWAKRRGFLRNKEADIALKIQRHNYTLVHSIENLVIHYEAVDKWNEINQGDKQKEYEWRAAAVDEALKQLEQTIESLILRFWESDSPDEF